VRRSLAVRTISLCIVLAVIRVHLGTWPGSVGAPVEVAILDVGQGQAVVIRGPHARCAVVDAAGTFRGRFDAGERVVVPWLSEMGCARLEALIITHDHDDHAGGAKAVLRELEVDELWYPAGTHGRPQTRELLDLAHERGVATVGVARGFRARRAGVELEVLHPTPWLAGLGVNDRSVVLRVRTDAGAVLVTGDLESPGEDSLLDAGVDPRADVLVAGHHGAVKASSWPFLLRVRPRIAVISVGVRNRFGHPSSETLARLERIGARTYRTDRDGTVRLVPTSRGWAVSPAGVIPGERPVGRE
jgi:competence protein ComEC